MRRRTLASLGALSLAAALTGCTESAESKDSVLSGPVETPSPNSSESQPTVQDSGDYGWFETNGELTEGFCFTWIAGRTPGQVLKKLGGRRLTTAGWTSDWEPFPGRQRGEAVMAVTWMPGWSLIVESNGVLALRDDLLKRLSTRTTVVSHFRNVEQDSRFLLVKNGDIRVAFNPYDPSDRTGSHPDVLLADMQAAGFPADGQDSNNDEATECAFTLTERLTGTPMTIASLHSAKYLVTAVYDADVAAWEEENPNPGLQSE